MGLESGSPAGRALSARRASLNQSLVAPSEPVLGSVRVAVAGRAAAPPLWDNLSGERETAICCRVWPSGFHLQGGRSGEVQPILKH